MPLVAAMHRRLWRAAIVLGIGLGGFVDGILLHQILQWHHMVTSVPGAADDVRLNTLLDGLFHAATWSATVAGVWLLHRAWRHERPDGRVLAGGLLTGWGAFHLVEGTASHHVLGIHHVWPAGPGPTWAWDVAFLALGAALVALGIALARPAENG